MLKKTNLLALLDLAKKISKLRSTRKFIKFYLKSRISQNKLSIFEVAFNKKMLSV